MVTLPSGSDDSYRHREIAGSFGADAEAYDRLRPRYPDALVDAVAERLPGPHLLDVGIGTGISSEPFRRRGCTVLGVEPDERMAALARAKGLVVEAGRFEDWDAAGRLFDGVIAGQAWHWIDPVAGAGKAAQALRPGGLIAIFWNSGSPPPAVSARFADVFASLETGLPFNPWAAGRRGAASDGAAGGGGPYATIIDRAAAGLASTGGFGPVEQLSFRWRAVVARDTWLEQTSTSGGINRLPKGILDALLTGLGRVIDDVGGTLHIDCATVAAMWRRLG